MLAAAGAALADYAHPAERAAVSEELARLATAAGDRALVLRAQARLVIDHLEMGALDRSARALDAYETLAREFRQPRHLWPGRLMRAMLASATGRFDEAEQLAAEAQAITPDDPISRVTHGWRRIGHALLCERELELAAAERALPAVFGIREFEPFAEEYVNIFLAILRARAGDGDSARRHLSAVPLTGHFYHHEYGAMAMMAEAIVLAGHEEAAAHVYERLAPLAGCVASCGRAGMVCAGPVDGARAMLAAFLGRPAEAAAHFQSALALASAAGLRPHLAQLQYQMSRFLQARALPGDRARAEELAAAAGVLAKELGLRLLQERLARQAAGEGAEAGRIDRGR